MTSTDASEARNAVREFWRLMGTNEFDSVTTVLASDFVLEWPQSRERIRGGERFARMNREYPTAGRWRFDVHRLVADGDTVVTHVTVSDGTAEATAVSFFTVVDGCITHVLEFWPDAYEPPVGRAHLTERF